MKLLELDPKWWTVDGRVVGCHFLCPHCRKESVGIAFANPVDGGAPGPAILAGGMPKEVHAALFENRIFTIPPGHQWTRTGDTFENLSLTPSVDASRAGCWHGFVTNGEIR